MPSFDGSGPRQEGTMTGWGRGYCIKVLQPDDPLFVRRAGPRVPLGRGFAHGFGRGRGRCFAYTGRGLGRGFGPRGGRYGYEERESMEGKESE